MKIDARNPFPFLRRDFPDRFAVHGDAGIVAGDMNRPEFLERGVGEFFHRRAIRNIGGHSHRVTAETAHIGERLLQLAARQIGKYDIHAVLREIARHAKSDAGGGAGHDCRLAFKVLHSCEFSCGGRRL